MGKANATIYAAAALGLCLMSPHGAAAAPATPDMSKAYTQAATGGNLTLARFGRGGGMGHVGGFHRFRRCPLRGCGRAPLWPRPRFRLRAARLLGRARHPPRHLWRIRRMGSKLRSRLGLWLASWLGAGAGRCRDGLGLWWWLGLSRLLRRWLFPGLFRWRWLLRLVGPKSDPAVAFASGEKWTAKHRHGDQEAASR